MTETFNVFDTPKPYPTNQPSAWIGENICQIQEAHESHNWAIVYYRYGLVEYACPGVGVSASIPTETVDISEENTDD